MRITKLTDTRKTSAVLLQDCGNWKTQRTSAVFSIYWKNQFDNYFQFILVALRNRNLLQNQTY